MRHTMAPVADLIFVTQLVDADDAVLGFTLRQVKALARRTRVVVIANEVRSVPRDLGADVLTLGKEAGRGRVRRTVAYQVALLRAWRRLERPVLFAHMCPEYVVAARPLARLVRLPLTLWFTHPSDSPRLGRAARASRRVFTAMPGSFPRRDVTAEAIGHSIDMSEFAVQPQPAGGPLRLLAVGRTSPVKGYAEIIRAVAETKAAGGEVVLRIVGGATTADEAVQRGELAALIEALDAADRVTLAGPVPPAQVVAELAGAHVLVSATAAGSADKAVFEALACGRPVVTSNPVFADLLGGFEPPLLYPAGDVAALAERLLRLASLPAGALSSLGLALRERVENAHSLDNWAGKIATAIDEVRSEPSGRFA